MVAVFSLLPVAAAQERVIHPADYVPDDFAGFIQVRLDSPQTTLRGLNIAAFAAVQVQPNRIGLGNAALTFDDFLPFNTWFDVDNISFTANVLPWIKDEFVVAYRDFNNQLQADNANILLILPTSSVLDSAAHLSAIIKQPDLLVLQPYRGIDVYEGKTASIALTSPVVFIGPTDLVHAALDVQAGVKKTITANPVYGVLRAASDESPLVFGYVDGDHVAPAVSGLVGGDSDSQALFAALGGALSQVRGDNSFETLLFNGGFDGAAASLDTDVGLTEAVFTAKAVFHSVTTPDDSTPPEFDSTLLDLIPHNALLVQTGADARGMIYDVVTALPMTNFARQMVGGLPIQTLGTESKLITVPDAKQVQAAVNSYLNVLGQFSGFDLQKDLIDHLAGSYTVALLPRPNNPLPVLKVPFDLLITARTSDDAALDGVSKLLQSLFKVKALPDATTNDWTFKQLGADTEPLFSLGLKDGLLIVATGDAAGHALDAQGGDNRLIDEVPWQTLSKTARPDFYVDTAVFYNTFFPSPGGAVPTSDNHTQLALHSAYQGSGIYELKFSALIPLA
ncbi:MAG: DUF3352 domain-containing protein [Chloroflexota bacterium]